MYYGSGTADRIASGQPADAAYAAAAAVYPSTRWQHFSVINDIKTAILTLYQKSDSVDRCIFT